MSRYSEKRFVCYFHLNGWRHIQFGAHVHIGGVPDEPFNIEIHVPFGFLRMGWELFYSSEFCLSDAHPNAHQYGFTNDEEYESVSPGLWRKAKTAANATRRKE